MAIAQRKALQLQLYIAYLVIILILLTSGIVVWFRRRMRQQLHTYRRQQEMTEQNIQQLLRRKDATIDEMKAEVDSKINELEQLKQKTPTHNGDTKTADSIEQNKIGSRLSLHHSKRWKHLTDGQNVNNKHSTLLCLTSITTLLISSIIPAMRSLLRRHSTI